MLIVVQHISVLSNWALYYYMLQPIKGTQIKEGRGETKRGLPRRCMEHQALQLNFALLLLQVFALLPKIPEFSVKGNSFQT